MQEKRDATGAAEYLADLFGGEQPQMADAALEVPDDGQPQGEPAADLFDAADRLGERVGDVADLDGVLWRRTPTGWIRADLDAADAPTWQDIDAELPEPCPTCDSLEWWIDGAGRRRCGKCDAAALERARKLADLAARLRKQSPLPTRPGPPTREVSTQAR